MTIAAPPGPPMATAALAEVEPTVTWRRLGVRRAWLIDGAITAGVLVLGISEYLRLTGPAPAGYRPADAYALVALVALVGMLLLRRTAPLPALAASVGLLFTLHSAGYQSTGVDGAVPLLLLYGAGAFQAHRHPLVTPAAAAASVAVGVALNLSERSLLSIAGLSCLCFATFWVGRIVHRSRADALTQRDRARRVEADREQRIARAVADERSHIARELHDVVAHSLGFIALEAEAGRAVFDRDPHRAREALETVGTAGRQGLAEMRRLLAVLREHDTSPGGAPRAPQPTLADLPALTESVRAAGLPVTLDTDFGRHATLPAGVQLSAYRIVQEALTNALKHADGATAHVEIRQTGDELQVKVTDTGTPLTVPYPRPSGDDAHVPHGIIGMRERAALYGGRLEAGPQDNTGWRVRAVLPTGDPAAREVPA